MIERAFSIIINDFYGRMKSNAKLEAGPVAMASASHGNIRVPDTTATIEIGCIVDEIKKYKQAFSLQEQSLIEYAHDSQGHDGKSGTSMCAVGSY